MLQSVTSDDFVILGSCSGYKLDRTMDANCKVFSLQEFLRNLSKQVGSQLDPRDN